MEPAAGGPAPGRRVALALMVLTPLLWSTAGVVTRWLSEPLRAGGGFETTFWRSAFAAAFVAAWLLRPGGSGLRAVAAIGRAGLASGLCWAVMFSCFMLALQLTTVANTLIVLAVGPLCTALLARGVLGAPIAPRTWVAIAAAGAGIVVMFAGAAGTGQPGQHAAGMLVALGAPLAAALNLVLLQKSRSRVDLVPAVLVGAGVSAAAMLPFMFPTRATATDVALLALLGCLQLGLPCVLLVIVARRLAAAEIALLALIEVVCGPLWAWIGAGESPGRAAIVGGAVVIGALVANEAAQLHGLRRLQGAGGSGGGERGAAAPNAQRPGSSSGARGAGVAGGGASSLGSLP